MAALLRLVLPFVLFPLAAAVVLRVSLVSLRWKLFALLNVLGALGICLLSPMTGLYFWQLRAYLEVVGPVFAVYLLIVVIHWVILRRYARQAGWVPWIAALFPIACMFAVKYLPFTSEPFRAQLDFIGRVSVVEFFVGLSYMAFRLSHLTLEVRNEIVPYPSIWEHVSFAFFVPTMAVGPISRYSVFRQSLFERGVETARKRTPVGLSLQRMLIGVTKYLFLASLIEQLDYSGLLLDSHPHRWVDLPVAAVAFYLYLYFNFSGYCDLAIGASGLLGIEVEENFNRPFTSRNLMEFWTRWHITLSSYLRDILFAPVSKELTRRMGVRNAPHAIAITILMVFLAMGAWHGLTWNFMIYGALHGVGVATCHYYTLFLKNRLGKKGYAAYERNRWIRAAGVTATFLYLTVTLFFFANSLATARTILRLLH
jgi:D-alanyl-lipoteichoic acid acyltransferase DltB (MBOAT superfamily)